MRRDNLFQIPIQSFLNFSFGKLLSATSQSGFKSSVSFRQFRNFRMASSPQHFANVVIGSGQGGTALAQTFAQKGEHTALIEAAHIGGCCINEGCTPTKTMVASGRIAYLARRGLEYGVHAPGVKDNWVGIDMTKVRQRKRDIITSFRGGGERRTTGAGVNILMGEARFVEKSQDRVTLAIRPRQEGEGEEKTITAERVFINTGERPAKPVLPGIESVEPGRVLDSTSVQELGLVPSHLIVLGGGYIGLEFGQLFRRLGSKVTIVQRSKQILPREDPEIAATLLKILEEDGITVLVNTSPKSVKADGRNALDLTVVSQNGDSQTLNGSHLLSAAGRTPNTDMLNLDAVGVKMNKRGYIEVNERLETNVPKIWALGDCKGPPAFTHIAYDDFRIIRANVIENAVTPLTIVDRFVPYVCYVDPQMGHVGLHESEAREKYADKKIMTAQMPMSYVARALETDETRGMMKAVVDGESGQILGFTCLGLEGGEIMTIVQMAMMGGLTWQKLRDATFAHPTLAESLNNLWGFLK